MIDIKLDRPLVFFDLETTGVSVQNDRIVEISVVKVRPDGTQEVKTRKLNPEMPIPKEASDIHGITDEDVADAPTFNAISKNLYVYLEGCDLAGFNSNKFDVPLLINEFQRAGLQFSVEGRRLIDAYRIFCQKEPRSLTAAYQYYCGKELEGAHGAEADTLATLEVFAGQLNKYDDLPKDIEELHLLCNQTDPNWIDSTGKFKWSGDDAIVGFGKNAGSKLSVIAVENPGFLRWMIKVDFPEDAKKIANDALIGEYPVKKKESKDA